MSFSNVIKSVVVFSLVLLSTSFAGEEKNGKVRSVIGQVETQKSPTKDWEQLKVGAKVKGPHKIRTHVEEQAVIALPDGSTFSIEENSLVEFTQLLSNDGIMQAMTDIKSGKIRFDVQKQSKGESSIKFKTGTATAGIRGTAGVIGVSTRGSIIASLRNGKLEISYGKNTINIQGGQTVVPNGDELIVLDLVSSGDLDFLNEIDKLISDTTKTFDEMKQSIISMDSTYKENLDKAKSSVNCKFEALPDTIYKEFASITGTCAAGIFVEISGERKESNGEKMTFTPSWESDAYGDKKFPVVCYVGKVSFDCGLLNTYYKQSDAQKQDTISADVNTGFEVKTSSPIRVCEEGAATVEGNFDASDTSATLFVKLGSYTSPNLVPISADGHWTHTIIINDQKNNWEETSISVEYNGKHGKQVVSIDLDVDKSCPNVNLNHPIIVFQRSDSLRCEANMSIGGIQNEHVIFTSYIDGTTLKESYFDKNSYVTTKLKSGLHNYKFVVKDQAGNISSFERELGCYPKNSANISFNNGPKERYRVPPPPSGHTQKFYKNMRFRITGVPQQDPSHIKRIIVKQGNNNILYLEGSQIKDLSYDVQVELSFGQTTDIQVIVEFKNSKQLIKTKTYEVR